MAELFRAEDVALAVGGRILNGGDKPGVGIARVDVDSRSAREGSLFVPLAGERVDGHDFIAEAAARGAKVSFIARARAEARPEEIRVLQRSIFLIEVDSPLKALQDLARFHRKRVPDVSVVGVTGSNGKTTTKEIIAAVLSKAFPTVWTEGNLNSEIGLPLSVFRIEAGHRYAVLEMGMNREGEMDILADLARPQAAVVTNIGTAHIGLLGSREAIAREKKKIFSFFTGKESAYLREDEPFRFFLGEGTRGRVVYYGPGSTRGFQGSRNLGLDGTAIDWEGLQIRFPLVGGHNLSNALAAISLAADLGVSVPDVREGLESVRPLFGRGQVFRGRVTVVEDCYNANPESVSEGLAFIRELDWKGRRIVVLGSMRELGNHADAAHTEIGRKAAEAGIDLAFFFGEEARAAFEAFRAAAPGVPARHTEDIEQLRKEIAATAVDGDLVYLKGSRGVELERVKEALVRS